MLHTAPEVLGIKLINSPDTGRDASFHGRFTRRLCWTRTKLYHAKCSDRAAFRLSSFLLKAFVSRVNRRICIRIVRFWRSALAR